VRSALIPARAVDGEVVDGFGVDLLLCHFRCLFIKEGSVSGYVVRY
jgi:hypothetical protein